MSSHCSLLFPLLLCGLFGQPAPAPAVANNRFPVAVSANQRHLLDRTGEPFLIHGDTAWSLIAALTLEEAERYLEDRRVRGINAIIVNLIEHKEAPAAPKNRQGEGPFAPAGNFSAPNEAYFQHADRVLKRAEDLGILVFLFPCYWGYNGGNEGFWKDLNANPPAACHAYGRFLGERYRGFANIVWVHGGDFSPPDDAPGVALGLEILRGIKSADPAKLHTFHGKRSTTALDHLAFAPHLDLDSVYTGDEMGKKGPDEPYRISLLAYNRPRFRPTFLIEARYENDARKTEESLRVASRARIRRQPYCAVLSGTTGHFFGNSPVWKFHPGWDGPLGIGSEANADLVHFREVFATRAWHRLIPDQEHRSIVAGYGSFGELDYVTAARADDGSFLIAYVPPTGTTTRTLTVEMSRLAGLVHARWFNPATGAYSLVAGSPLAGEGTRDFTTPGDNGTGANDWVLVLESAAPKFSRSEPFPHGSVPGRNPCFCE